MRILVTGAAGFIGSALAKALSRESVVATDQRAPAGVLGDIADARFARSLITRDIEVVFHLAALVSGGAEGDFERGMKVNLDATRALLEACRVAGHRPKFVFASSIAVYGGALPDPVVDDTPASPRISYGAQKLVCEILIDEYTRRGYVDGRALRLPAVMVRGDSNTGVSGWSSAIIREPLAGRDYVCPVRPETKMACISRSRLVEALLRISQIESDRLGFKRTVLLTGIPVSAGEMWDAVRARARGKVRFQPDPVIQAIMDAGPKGTRSERAARLGLPESRDIEEIVSEYQASLPNHG